MSECRLDQTLLTSWHLRDVDDKLRKLIDKQRQFSILKLSNPMGLGLFPQVFAIRKMAQKKRALLA
jgi:hypothetical protein